MLVYYYILVFVNCKYKKTIFIIWWFWFARISQKRQYKAAGGALVSTSGGWFVSYMIGAFISFLAVLFALNG